MITVETGAIVLNANSYISVTDFTTYATARGYTLVSGGETLLIQAMDYIESLYYVGTKYTAAQGLQWPRSGVYIDGYLFDYDDIPQELINAQCQVAIAIDQGNGPLLDLPRSTKREKVGPIEVEYSDNASSVIINRKIMAMLSKLLAGGGGGLNFNVSRG